MRTKYNKRRFRTAIMILILLLCMSIGYSYLLTTLNIEGTSNIKANSWDVHWENVSVKSGSVTGDQVPIAAHVMSNTTQVEYSVILKNPGEYYEFTVDAVNAGSLDAMVSITDTKFYEANGVTQINLPNYLDYSFTYEDGVEIELNTKLEANSSETYKVRIKFKDNLDDDDLPTTDKTIVIRQSITYIQADETALSPRIIRYSFTDGYFYLCAPESDITESYSTPEEVIAASGYPFFLRHVKNDDLYYTSEVGFKYNGNFYYLKGGVDETALDQKPIYEENVDLLYNIFNDIICNDYGVETICYPDDYTVSLNTKGDIVIVVNDLEQGRKGCTIFEDSNEYFAHCGGIAA